MRKIVFAVLVCVVSFFVLAGSSYAMCIYNETAVLGTNSHPGQRLVALFDCGVGCANNWTIEPGVRTCRGGKAGTISVQLECNGGGKTSWSAKSNVEKGGEVKVVQSSSNPPQKFSVKTYKSKKSLTSVKEVSCP